MYVMAQRRICVEFCPVRQFAVSQDLGQPDSCEKADRHPGLNPGRLSNDPRFLGELRWKPLTFAEAS